MSGAAEGIASRLTREQFLELPDEPERRHAELIDGQVIMNPPTWLRHGGALPGYQGRRPGPHAR